MDLQYKRLPRVQAIDMTSVSVSQPVLEWISTRIKEEVSAVLIEEFRKQKEESMLDKTSMYLMKLGNLPGFKMHRIEESGLWVIEAADVKCFGKSTDKVDTVIEDAYLEVTATLKARTMVEKAKVVIE